MHAAACCLRLRRQWRLGITACRGLATAGLRVVPNDRAA